MRKELEMNDNNEIIKDFGGYVLYEPFCHQGIQTICLCDLS